MKIVDIFDADYYNNQSLLDSVRGESLEHYQSVGWLKSRSPSPYFNAVWYKIANKDVQTEPLAHFCSYGSSELRDPHPLFKASWYADRYLDHSALQPLEHYLSSGWKEGAQPHVLFWSRWYSKEYLKNQSVDPFLHYITVGWQMGCNPNPLFDTEYYLKEYGGGNGFDPDPFSHYIHVGWRKGYNPHPLFDSKLYCERSNISLTETVISPLEDFLSKLSPSSPHILFDADFYEAGLIRQEDESDLSPLVIYLKRGPSFHKAPHPFFSKTYYLANHAHKTLGRDALIHYAETKSGDRCNPHPLFDDEFYSQHACLQHDENALSHYLKEGFIRNLHCRPFAPPDTTTRLLPTSRKLFSLSTAGNDEPVIAPTKKGKSVGVFVHIFHLDLADEIIKYLNNIPITAMIYVSTDEVYKKSVLATKLSESCAHPFEIRVLPNRGRDIAPFIVGFADRLAEVELGLHIHTKKSLHYGSSFDHWRRHLLELNLGSPEIIAAILEGFDTESVGIYAPDHYRPIRDLLQWGGNLTILNGLLSLVGEEVHAGSTLDFASGSMFWFRTSALKPLLQLDLRFYHFDPEVGQVDGTLAHAIERGLFMICEAAGFDWLVGTKALGYGRVDRGNRYFPTERDLGSLRRYVPECTSALFRATSSKRPRVNLLLPTIDTKQGYAGVETALSLFLLLQKRMGDLLDFRLMATDVSPSDQYDPPEDFDWVQDGDDTQHRAAVENIAKRYLHPIFIREHDVFIATAWWTAMLAKSALGWQNQTFGLSSRKFIYVIQDFECGFYPWSMKYMLAESTYKTSDEIIPMFNTSVLAEDFRKRGLFQNGLVLSPGINTSYAAALQRDLEKERIVLLYMRPHADRNCLPFIDLVIDSAVNADPIFWSNWKFLAIGENFDQDIVKVCKSIAVLGRLTIPNYAAYASRAALGVSLMVSPHPSYPPLEMAEAGMLVISNIYEGRNPSDLHDNIFSFDLFDYQEVACQLRNLARRWEEDPKIGWTGKPKVSWFFGGGSNRSDVLMGLENHIRSLVGI